MCGSAKTFNLSSDSVSVLSGLTDGNVAAVVIQNPLDLDRWVTATCSKLASKVTLVYQYTGIRLLQSLSQKTCVCK